MRNRLIRKPNSGGFTLIEQIAAIAILATGLLGSTRLFAEALRTMRDGAHDAAATAAAQSLLEHIVAGGIADVVSVVRCSMRAGDCPTATQASIARWQAELPANLPQSDIFIEVADDAAWRRLVVRFQWHDSRGMAASRQLERLVRR